MTKTSDKTTDELYEIIRNELVEGVESTNIVNAVLPMLEQAWEEGWAQGRDDQLAMIVSRPFIASPNPYRISS